MSYDSYHLQTLIQLGLTPNQGKLYLTLLSIGKATGSALSKETCLARQEVYRILHELHASGLVEKIITTPTEFQAVPIQDGISILMMEKARELEQTKERVQSLIDEYSLQKISVPKKEYKFLMIPPKKLVHEARERMFENSKETIQLTSTNKRFSQGISHFFEVWERTLKRNVSVQVIIVGEKMKFNASSKLRQLEQYPNFSARFTLNQCAGLLVVDKLEAIVTLQPEVDLGASAVFWTNHPEFILIYHEYFMNIWNNAQTSRATLADS